MFMLADENYNCAARLDIRRRKNSCISAANKGGKCAQPYEPAVSLARYSITMTSTHLLRRVYDTALRCPFPLALD
ncbi:hypothetical protein BB8028_0005g01130 [Beauveria bassiana]|uniref:Uncharacterized protein n=1 Tax=Beauveria bassiana TaxID=176275 RepID=A0A2S7YFE1_BEABA|nr:hypothetical protein BB8028_0005g01130 [Beauveria bassiana]